MKFFVCVMMVLGMACACTPAEEKGEAVSASAPRSGPLFERMELFTDSLAIGRPGHNKITMLHFRVGNNDFVEIDFYTKQNNTWAIRNNFRFEKDGVIPSSPQSVDMNGDRAGDFTFVSLVAARGANDVRQLLVYDPKNDSLVWMKNSEQYPNLRYNKTLRCIDSWAVYGGSTTSFLRISGDSLKKFAEVNLFDGISVIEFDKDGNEKILLQDSSERALMVRYETYRPLRQLADY